MEEIPNRVITSTDKCKTKIKIIKKQHIIAYLYFLTLLQVVLTKKKRSLQTEEVFNFLLSRFSLLPLRYFKVY